MPSQIAYDADANYGFYGGFKPAPRTSVYSASPGPRRGMVMRDTYFGSRPRSGTWVAAGGARDASSFRSAVPQVTSGGFYTRKRPTIIDDDVEMIAAPSARGMYRFGGRGRYQRRRIYKRRRMRRY